MLYALKKKHETIKFGVSDWKGERHKEIMCQYCVNFKMDIKLNLTTAWKWNQ